MSTTTTRPQLHDPICGRTPAQIDEYLPAYTGQDVSADDYVWHNEGTLDRDSGKFLCTSCYIKAGQPTAGRNGRWTAKYVLDDKLASTSEKGPVVDGFHLGFRKTWTTWEGERREAPVHEALVASSETHIQGVHRPVLDLDVPAQLVPSTTPGHHHLYIDVDMSWPTYKRLLRALAKAGVIEAGYAKASIHRGASFVRLPWVRKVGP